MKNIFLLLTSMITVICSSPKYPNVEHGICGKEIQSVTETRNVDKSLAYRNNLMNTAVCLHTKNYIAEAIQFYLELREIFPDYAFTLVNIAAISLKVSLVVW